MTPSRSPTPALLFGLILTLAAVGAYSYYINRQISGLRVLQEELIDRNRRDSLQLLRIQNNLNALGLAMQDMLEGGSPYPLTAWTAQFGRIRRDLEHALAEQDERRRDTDRVGRQRLIDGLAQFWDAADRTFALAAAGGQDEARAQVRLSLQARQASLHADVARLLFENNENEADAAARIQAIYDQVERQVYLFFAATMAAIVATSLYLIRSNRRLFAEMSTLADRRRELAQQLIATRESTLRHLSRELHDEFGQSLTAMGSMLARAERRAPEDSPLRAELREVAEIAQATLTNVRSLSQTLHPSLLEELGLESTLDWYLPTVEKQLGLTIHYGRAGAPVVVDGTTGIHFYRVLQEALSNVARHSGTNEAWVRLRSENDVLEIEVEDHGVGLPLPGVARRRVQPGVPAVRRGLGLVTMRERADLLGGDLSFGHPPEGGTIVRLRAPLRPPASDEGDADDR